MRRWASLWHQMNEIISSNSKSILEIGPGLGLLKQNLTLFDIHVTTLDHDERLGPDFVGSALDLPFEANSFDCACAFQMLEHLPYEESLNVVSELSRVAKNFIMISLPDKKPVYRYSIQLPILGFLNFFIIKPQFKPRKHEFDGQHYWELNATGYDVNRVLIDLEESSNMKVKKCFRVQENPRHRFIVLKK